MKESNVQLLEQRLEARGFKPLPVGSLAKKFADERNRQRMIVAGALSSVLDGVPYMELGNIKWAPYRAGREVFDRNRVDIHNELKNAESYLGGEQLQANGIMCEYLYSALVMAHPELPTSARLRAGRGEHLYYKDREKMVSAVRADHPIVEVKFR